MKRTISFTLAAAFLLCACTSMSVKTEVVKIADAGKEARRIDEARIEVFYDSAPSSQYVTLASIKATGRRDVEQGELVKALRQRAARLGADAIIDVKFSEDLTAGGAGGKMVCPFDQPCYYEQTQSTIIGLPVAECKAVRYGE